MSWPFVQSSFKIDFSLWRRKLRCGGFVYNEWSTTPPDGFDNRPLNDGGGSQNQGLQYYYNNKGYYTRAGNDGAGRIQAFGGCAVNTIQGNVSSSQLIGGANGENYCSFDDKGNFI